LKKQGAERGSFVIVCRCSIGDFGIYANLAALDEAQIALMTSIVGMLS
jgi:hypothetical protein